MEKNINKKLKVKNYGQEQIKKIVVDVLFFLLAVIKLGTESKSAVKFINVPHRLSRFFF